MNNKTYSYTAWHVVYFSMFAVATVLVLFSFIYPLSQIAYFLWTGEWVKIPVLYIFISPDYSSIQTEISPLTLVPTYIHGRWNWIENPTSWLGVYKILYWILEFVPLWILWLCAGWLTAAAGSGLSDEVSKAEKKGRKVITWK